MMAALVLNKKLNHKKTWTDIFIAFIERKYQPVLQKVLGIPKLIFEPDFIPNLLMKGSFMDLLQYTSQENLLRKFTF
jgi:hypothetical protein